MKRYNKPEIELIEIDCADIIAASVELSKLPGFTGEAVLDDTGKSLTTDFGGITFNSGAITY